MKKLLYMFFTILLFINGIELFAQGSTVTATGAGTTGANLTYNESITQNGKTSFTNGSWTIYWDGSAWKLKYTDPGTPSTPGTPDPINIGLWLVPPNPGTPPTDYNYYSNSSNTTLPPQTGWTVLPAGTSPAPTLSGDGTEQPYNAPTDITLTDTNIDENAGANGVVGTLTSTDADVDQSHTYSLVSGTGDTDNDSFNVYNNSGTWQLRATASLNYEAKQTYYVRIRSTDVLEEGPNAKIDFTNISPLYFEKQFTVTVNNVWETPTDITLTDQSIPENEGVNGVVGVLTTTDPDVGQQHSYGLVSGEGSTDNASFNVYNNGGTWQLRANSNLNFEQDNETYSVRIRTTDVIESSIDLKISKANAEPLYYEESFTITLTNENDTPQDLVLSNDEIDENEPATTYVGQFVTVDQDPADLVFTYSLVEGTGDTDNALFTIVGNSLLLASPLDHETAATRSIRVQTKDAGNATYVEQFTINVVDINEAPTGPSLTGNYVYENSASGTTVGTFSPDDEDDGDTHTYQLVNEVNTKASVTNIGGSGNGYNAFTIEGNTLKTSTSFNYEGTYQSYFITVKVTDNGNPALSSTDTFTIYINDVNEAATGITLNDSIIAENAGTNGVVGALTTTGDPDNGQSHIYSLVTGTGSDDNSLFDISGSNLVAKNSLNFEARTPASYKVRVKTTDQIADQQNLKIDQTNDFAALSYEKEFVITVTDVNDTPTAVLLSNNRINENSSTGQTIGTFTTTDDESSTQSYTYALLVPTSPKLNTTNPEYVDQNFEIVGNALKNKIAFNYELQNSYTIYVQTTDNGSPNKSYIQSLTIYIDNVNEKPTLSIGTDPVTFVEKSSGVKLVTEASISDLDFPQELINKFSVTDGEYLYLNKATVQITGNYDADYDQLFYSIPGNSSESKTTLPVITNGFSPTWDVQTGTLTFTGVNSFETYESALENVYFHNSSTSPDTTVRTITFVLTDVPVNQQDGADLNKTNNLDDTNTETGLESDPVARTVNFTLVNDAPMLSEIGETVFYNEGDGPVQITSTILVNDDNAYNTLEGATVTIGEGYVEGEDFLRYTTTNLITGEFNGVNGSLALSGSRSFSDYQEALRAVKFENTSENPTQGNREVIFIVDDPGGDEKPNLSVVNIESEEVSKIVNVSGVNDAPVISSIQTGQMSYQENSGEQQIFSSIHIDDIDDGIIHGATIQITGNPHESEDVLSLVAPLSGPKFSEVYANIAVTWDSVNAMLTLVGEASLATYQQYLTSVKYENTSDDPTTEVRTVTFKVNDRSADQLDAPADIKQTGSKVFAESNGLTREIAISAVNDNPVVVNNTGISVVTGGSVIISNVELLTTDIDFDQYLMYTVKQKPAHGMLKNDNTEIPLDGTFFQSDINEGSISYMHDGGASTSDAFLIEVSDNQNGKAPLEAVSITILTDNSPPAPPRNIVIELNEQGQAVLSWTNGEGEIDGIQVWRQTVSTSAKNGSIFSHELIATLPQGSDSFVDETAEEGVSYIYQLIAFNDNGSSGTLDEEGESNAPLLPAQLTKPSSLSAIVNENGSVTLNWNDNSNLEDGYKIERSSGVSNWTEIGMVEAGVTSFSDETVSEGVTYSYRVKAFNSTLESAYSDIEEVTSIITGIDDWIEEVPSSYNLQQNYPNPFNPSTTIRFGLPREGFVAITIFNILGQEMATLVNNVMSAGYHEVQFDATNLTSGIYIYKIQAGDFVQIKKMMLMK